MNDDPQLHRQLARQLRRLKLGPNDLPTDLATWHELLSRISQTYGDYDEGRYLLERSLEISSREMREMYDTLKLQASNELAQRAEELMRLNEELEKARDVAIAASQTKSSFLAHMSHELRTPLNGIIGYTELMLEDIEELERDEMIADLRRIRHSGKHLLAMINDLLDLSKIEAGEMSIFRETLSLETLLRDVRDTLSPLLDPSIDYIEQAPSLHIVEDRGKLTQILINLLANAIKYTDAGEVGITITAREDTLTFTVHDTGEGIGEEDAHTIFESFRQLEHHEKQSTGTGLGLAITQRLVHLLDGTITLESTLGQGSTFTVTLPRHTTA